jgi:hypothetical protein
MLFANHLAVSFRATTLATAYRALTVAQALIVLLPAHCCLLLLGGVVDYGLPHLCTSVYRALTVAQAQIVLCCPAHCCLLLGGVVDYGLYVVRTCACLPISVSAFKFSTVLGTLSSSTEVALQTDQHSHPSRITLDRILLLSEEDNAAWLMMDVEEVPVVRSKWHVLVSSYR